MRFIQFSFFLIIVPIISIITSSLYAQERQLQSFNGPYRLKDSLQGTAQYLYFLNEDEIEMKHGPFKFEHRSYDPDRLFRQYTYTGGYEDGLKNGKWTYENHQYEIDIKDILRSDLTPKFSLSGLQTQLQAHYEKGNAIDGWVYEEYLVTEGGREKLSELILNFKNGRLIGNFSYEGKINNAHARIQGQINDRHYLDGVWQLDYTLDSTHFEERRMYDNGFLTYINVQSDSSVIYDHTFTTVINKLRQERDSTQKDGFTIDEDYFGWLFDDGYLKDSPQIKSQINGNYMLEQVTDKLFKQKIGGLELSGLLYLEPGATRRFHYVHTADNRRKLDELDSLVNHYTAEITKYTDNTSLSVNRQRSDSLALSYKLLTNMLNRLDIISSGLTLVKSNKFRNQSIENHFRKGIPDINRIDTITYTFNNKENSTLVHYETSITNASNIFDKQLNYVREIGNQFKDLLPYLDNSLQEIEQDNRIVILEESMSRHLSYVDSLYINQKNGNHRPQATRDLIHPIVRNYKRASENILQEYADTDDYDAKSELGNQLISMSTTMLDMYPIVSNVDLWMDQLDEAYTSYVSNRFLEEHSIRTRIKRGIYSTGVEYLIPELLDQIKRSGSVDDMANLSDRLERSVQRLLDIAELDREETQPLERKLRNVRNINKILSLLEV